jgi:thioredoxin-dependent peroxiredoxin
MERKGGTTFKGNPLTLVGQELKIGQKAPDFRALTTGLNPAGLGDYAGKSLLIAAVPSLDTPVCDLEIKRFNKEATAMSKDVVVIFVSMDLPFAQKRFCESFDIARVTTLSDHREASFGEAFGVLIKELRLLSRAIFIVDKTGLVRYVEYVKEMTEHPQYDEALKALKGVLGRG